ncbi:MAG: hypothetical protein IT374_11940 [Polyangiaceae bacterium]|nr:hypothetical protein [Polyangiaceae bacterium]
MTLALLPGLVLAAAAGALAAGPPLTKLAVAGLVAVPAAGASLAFARLREGLDARGVTRVAAHLTASALLALPPLALLGATLKTHTHHRALGGATFAVLAVGVVAGALWLGGKIADLVARGGRTGEVASLTVYALVWGAVLARAGLLTTARLDHAAVAASIAVGFALGPRLLRASAPVTIVALVMVAGGVGLTAATPAGAEIVARGAIAGALARVVRPIAAD